jgi:hypothetical protein
MRNSPGCGLSCAVCFEVLLLNSWSCLSQQSLLMGWGGLLPQAYARVILLKAKLFRSKKIGHMFLTTCCLCATSFNRLRRRRLQRFLCRRDFHKADRAISLWCVYAVTLLALGNGAPDLVSSIAFIKAGQYRVAISGLLGTPPPPP